MQIARDSALLLALREEVNTAYVTDPATGARALSIQQVSNLPLLTSAYTEALRLSMSFNVVRDVRETFTLDGYTIEKGALVQVPTLAAHYDEKIWGAEEHPASEFWAERHIKYVDEKDECGNVTQKRVFAMAGKTGSHYFPYGKY
jgi:cytochrome P450